MWLHEHVLSLPGHESVKLVVPQGMAFIAASLEVRGQHARRVAPLHRPCSYAWARASCSASRWAACWNTLSNPTCGGTLPNRATWSTGSRSKVCPQPLHRTLRGGLRGSLWLAVPADDPLKFGSHLNDSWSPYSPPRAGLQLLRQRFQCRPPNTGAGRERRGGCVCMCVYMEPRRLHLVRWGILASRVIGARP